MLSKDELELMLFSEIGEVYYEEDFGSQNENYNHFEYKKILVL